MNRFFAQRRIKLGNQLLHYGIIVNRVDRILQALLAQANNATRGHAQSTGSITSAQARAIVARLTGGDRRAPPTSGARTTITGNDARVRDRHGGVAIADVDADGAVASLDFWTWHFIEEGWDYGFVEAQVGGEWVTVPLVDDSGATVTTDDNPHGNNTEGNGLTGTSGGASPPVNGTARKPGTSSFAPSASSSSTSAGLVSSLRRAVPISVSIDTSTSSMGTRFKASIHL